ncbi:MAG: PKD domain-containing protein, partial [Candidatus Poribacteria bacterium]|nr:PKD domain-containing protein [Candidatus Poribacteria bacterium]
MRNRQQINWVDRTVTVLILLVVSVSLLLPKTVLSEEDLPGPGVLPGQGKLGNPVGGAEEEENPPIVALPDTVNFSTLEIDQSKVEALTIENNSDRELGIDRLESEIPGLSWLSQSDIVILPDSTHDIDLTFQPDQVGIVEGTLKIFFDGKPDEPIVIQIQAEVLPPPPSITDVSLVEDGDLVSGFPKGRVEGGEAIAIRGEGFQPGLTVEIAGNPATEITLEPAAGQIDQIIKVRTPSGQIGYADVTVTNPDGQQGELTKAFAYGIASVFSVGGTVDSIKDLPTLNDLRVVVENLDTGNALETVTKNEGRYQVAYADFNNDHVVALGDEVQIIVFKGQRPLALTTRTIEVEDIQNKTLIVDITLGQSASQLNVENNGPKAIGQSVTIDIEFQDEDGNTIAVFRPTTILLHTVSGSGNFYYEGRRLDGLVQIQPGQSGISLIYSDSNGRNTTITVSVPDQDITPTTSSIQWVPAALNFVKMPDDQEVKVKETVDFTAEVDAVLANLPANSQLTYNWDFGDGDTDDTFNTSISHTYQEIGDYLVKVQAELSLAGGLTVATEIAQSTVSVEPTAIGVKEGSGLEDVEVGVGEEASFAVEVDLPAAVKDRLIYNWDFGDGEVLDGSKQAQVSHVYQQAGDYPVSVTIQLPAKKAGQAPLEMVFEALATVEPTAIGVKEGSGLEDVEVGVGEEAS